MKSESVFSFAIASQPLGYDGKHRGCVTFGDVAWVQLQNLEQNSLRPVSDWLIRQGNCNGQMEMCVWVKKKNLQRQISSYIE